MEQSASNSRESGNEFLNQRLANMLSLKELGYEPFGRAYTRTDRLAAIRAQFQEGKSVRIAGRLVARREMGKSIFAHIQDGSDRFQLYMNRESVGEAGFAAFKILDIGDQIGCEGELFLTRTGEQTLKLHHWELLSKSLRPLPEKWHGLQDVEARYRQRYLDLISNQDVRRLFEQRITAIREIRNFLFDRGFLEVETPMIQPMAGGASATPFQTRYHALSADMYFRIAPELYLKRLLVGGFDKIFELNRNFRNEGLSRRHNPEFTMLEIYEAFGDVHTMKQLIQDMICHVATKVFGSLKVGAPGHEIDLTTPWRSVNYNDLITEKAGADWFGLSIEQARERAASLDCEVDASWSFIELTNEIYEKLIERTLINPTFVTRLPQELVPLAKRCGDNPDLVDVFELEIGGYEIAPGYTELNDPIDQRIRLEAQAQGDATKIDEDFLLALEHGMPPAGGMGVGIDRLIMILTGAESIRDVILFPQLKPRPAAE